MMDQITTYYRKYSVLVWPILVIIVSLIVIVTIIIPQLQSYLTQRNKLLTQTSQLNNFVVKAKDLEQIDEATYINNLKAALSALPTGKDVPQALIQLQTLINQTGMILEGIKFSSLTVNALATTPTGKNSFELVVSVSGTADSLKRLLNDIPKQQRKFNVNQVSMQTLSKGGGVEADVAIEVFYQPAVTTTASIDAQVPKLSKQEQDLLQQMLSRYTNSQTQTLDNQVPLGKANPFE